MVSIEKLKAFRSYFIVLAFIIAAILTPPDVVSQLALAIPMCLLYEVGIWAAVIFIKHTQPPAEEKAASEAERPRRCALGYCWLGRDCGRCATVTLTSSALSPRCTRIVAVSCGLSAATALSSCGVLATGVPAIRVTTSPGRGRPRSPARPAPRR